MSRANNACATSAPCGTSNATVPPRRAESRGATQRISARVGERDEPLGLPHALRADRVDAGGAQRPRPFDRRVERRNRRCPAEPAPGAGRGIHRRLERERAGVRLPPGRRRHDVADPVAQRRRRPEKAAARSAAQPLEHPTGEEIDAQRVHVDGEDADRVVGVERDERADLARPADDRCDVHHVRRAEEHVRDRDEPRPLVDGRDDPLGVDRHAVVARHDDDAGAHPGGERVDDVAYRRKVERRHDDRVARRGVVERRDDRRVRGRDVRDHRDLARRGSEQRRHLVADRDRQLPPPRGPRLHAQRLPGVGVRVQPVARGARHGA